MSTTTIYKLGSNVEVIGETHNGHRAAMYVWNQIAQDYFAQDYFPMFDMEMAKKIWNADESNGLSANEVTVLSSTMDKAVVSHTGIPQLIEAFKAYGESHENSAYTEQAEILSSVEIKEGEFVAWQQTSCGEFWAELEWNEEDEDYDYYDPRTGDLHFDVFAS